MTRTTIDNKYKDFLNNIFSALKKLSDKHKKLSKINLKLESKLNHYQAAYWEVLTKTKEHDREVKDKICEIDRLSKYIDHVRNSIFLLVSSLVITDRLFANILG